VSGDLPPGCTGPFEYLSGLLSTIQDHLVRPPSQIEQERNDLHAQLKDERERVAALERRLMLARRYISDEKMVAYEAADEDFCGVHGHAAAIGGRHKSEYDKAVAMLRRVKRQLDDAHMGEGLELNLRDIHDGIDGFLEGSK
jgi:hypothetical protein